MEDFINYLKSKEMSQNTISSYSYAVSQFLSRYTTVNDESLLSHKDWLVSEFATKTANNRIGALNCYLDHIGYDGMRLRGVRVQQKPFEMFCTDRKRTPSFVYSGVLWVPSLMTDSRLPSLAHSQPSGISNGISSSMQTGSPLPRFS